MNANDALKQIEGLVAKGYSGESQFKELESALVDLMNISALSQEENMRLYQIGIELILQGVSTIGAGDRNVQLHYRAHAGEGLQISFR